MFPDVDINIQALKTIKKNIQKHSPHPHKVTIVAVTKTLSFSALQSAEKNHIFYIGENTVQETQQKTQNKQLHPKTQLHLIGHLQSNKASLAVSLYDVIQSVDSFKLLNKINKSAEKHNKIQKIFLQINILKAPTQSGFQEDEINLAARLAKQLSYIQTIGLMAIGAHTNNKTIIKKHFQTVHALQQKIQNTTDNDCKFLSLGMSQDYILALQAGATHLRLGTILFQRRNAN